MDQELIVLSLLFHGHKVLIKYKITKDLRIVWSPGLTELNMNVSFNIGIQWSN